MFYTIWIGTEALIAKIEQMQRVPFPSEFSLEYMYDTEKKVEDPFSNIVF